MIVLDEQLLGRGIEIAIARWYPGSVCFINDLRPGTIIKDESIPTLLREQNSPTFVTINESDFWRTTVPFPDFCLVCANLPDSQAQMIDRLLRCLLRHPSFQSKAQRMGLQFRLSLSSATYYTWRDATFQTIANWQP